MDAPLLVNPDVDYTKALPIQQKRIIAFINHFIMNTVSFLNTFAQSCESRLMDFEFKLQKVDASLKILESQLSSISDENFVTKEESNIVSELPEMETTDSNEIPIDGENEPETAPETDAVNLKEDPKYSKYFKMVHVGVPVQAVKLKMQSEGLDPSVLDGI